MDERVLLFGQMLLTSTCLLVGRGVWAQVSPAQPSDSSACHAALGHLTVTAPALIEDGLLGHTPVEYLFSEDGDDVYSATSFDPNQEGQYLHGNVTIQRLLGGSNLAGGDGMRFIVVYQDEKSRQQAIGNLSKPGVLSTILVGSHAPLENLKFAVVHVQIDDGGPGSSVDKQKYGQWIMGTHSEKENISYELQNFKWSIVDIAYFEPKECIARANWGGSNFPAYDGMGNWIGDLNTGYPYKKLEPYNDPQYSRTIQILVSKLKRFVDETLK